MVKAAQPEEAGPEPELTSSSASAAGRAAGLRILYLCSGPSGRKEGFDAHAEAKGAIADMIDVENSEDHDITQDANFERIMAAVEAGSYDALLIAAPCSTFTPARDVASGESGGPLPLRGPRPPEIYGRADLSPADKEKVRIGTLIAVRCARAARTMHAKGLPWTWETPDPRPGKPSVFVLPEVQALDELPGVSTISFPQCEFGARAMKMTALKGSARLEGMPTACSHPKRWWRVPWSGAWKFGSHSPLRGRQWAVPAEEWTPRMLTRREPPGPYITREAAAYPGQLNLKLATSLIAAARAARSQRASSLAPAVGADPPEAPSDYLSPKVHFSERLRGEGPNAKELRQREDADCLAGMRNAAVAIKRLPGHARVGKVMHRLLTKALDEVPGLERSALEAIADPEEDRPRPGPSDELLEKPRRWLAKVLGARSIEAVDNDMCTTPIRADLLHRWAILAEDPGAAACTWLWSGAPGGLEETPSEVDGVFPRASDQEEVCDPNEVCQPADEFTNYSAFERDEAALSEILEYERKGFLRSFENLETLRAYVQGEPVISRFAVISRARNGKTKRRLILDLKQSRVTACTRKTHRVVLPRVTDTVQDMLEHLADLQPGETTEWFILDFVEAFWNIPLHPTERKRFVGKAGGRFYVFQRAAQGSRNGPLAWAAIASLLIRCTQGLFAGHGAHLKGQVRSEARARFQLYVDDPASALRGNPQQRDRMVAIIIVMWRSLGFPLAFSKAARGPTVKWIGCLLTVTAQEVHVTIAQDKIDELLTTVEKHRGANVISTKDLRSLIGLACHFASVLYVWRPFLNELWAALQDTSANSRAPPNCVWTRQISHTLDWLAAFLQRQRGALSITYSLDAYLNRGPPVRIVGDASPWGMGAYLVQGQAITAWYATAISPWEAALFGTEIGSHTGQQLWEALNLLIALRLWKSVWKEQRARLEVRADNVSALTLVTHLRARGVATNLIARELALDLGDGSFRPDLCVHTPGIASKLADALSRRFEPKVASCWQIPAALLQAPEAQPPARDASFFTSFDAAARHADLRRGRVDQARGAFGPAARLS